MDVVFASSAVRTGDLNTNGSRKLHEASAALDERDLNLIWETHPVVSKPAGQSAMTGFASGKLSLIQLFPLSVVYAIDCVSVYGTSGWLQPIGPGFTEVYTIVGCGHGHWGLSWIDKYGIDERNRSSLQG